MFNKPSSWCLVWNFAIMSRWHSHTFCQIIIRLITKIVTVFPIHIIWLFDKNLRTLGQSTCHKGRIKYWSEKFLYIVWWYKVLTSLFPFLITVYWTPSKSLGLLYCYKIAKVNIKIAWNYCRKILWGNEGFIKWSHDQFIVFVMLWVLYVNICSNWKLLMCSWGMQLLIG